MQHGTPGDAHAAIRALIERHYFRGMDELSFDVFEPAFHPAVRITFVQSGEPVCLDLAAWGERLAAIRADTDHPLHHERSEKSLESLDVEGDVACATVRFRFPSRRYTDYLTFAFADGRWRIVSKTFHLALSS